MAHIYQGAQGDYYVIGDIKYDAHFPEEWAKDHKDFPQGSPYEDYLACTGPEKCENCAFYGSLRGVFVGYCSNCARDYDFSRGKGYLYEDTQEEMWEKLDYMKGVTLNQIGDLYVDTVEEDEPDYNFPMRVMREQKIMKKGAERRKRRAMRKRRMNGKYVGIPEIPEIPENKVIENKVITISIFIILVGIILMASMSFYLI